MNAINTLEKLLLRLVEELSVEELAKRIDHAVLSPTSTPEDLEKALSELDKYKLRCLITTPLLAREARPLTTNCVGAVVGFPHGIQTLEAKIKELEDVIGYGVDDVDIVINYHMYIYGREDYVKKEVRALTSICKEVGVKCKIIVEAPALSSETLIRLTRLVLEHEPDYIKTSSGYGPRPTYPEDVFVIARERERLGKTRVGIKAAGGIRTPIQALTMMALGANIIGTSRPADLIEKYKLLRETS